MKRLNVKCFNTLIDELRAVESLAVTCDFWSDKRMKSYLCLTGHYLIGNRLKSTTLAFNVFDERHTSENIAQAIEFELKRLKAYDKASTITCDGASNMKKAFDYLQLRRIQCIAHKLHLVICNGLCLWAKTPIHKKATSKLATIPSDPHEEDESREELNDSTNNVLCEYVTKGYSSAIVA